MGGVGVLGLLGGIKVMWVVEFCCLVGCECGVLGMLLIMIGFLIFVVLLGSDFFVFKLYVVWVWFVVLLGVIFVVGVDVFEGGGGGYVVE